MPQTDSPAPRILVVEDDEAIRSTMCDILELNGYTVYQAGDGMAGVAAALAQSPDMILADIAMPRMDGLAMIDALHADERTRAIPIIIVSASVELERMREGMDRGAEDFLVKPFTEDQVLRSIKARFEKKALLDELDAFAHTVAHDLKNPIATMMARASLMRLSWTEESDEQKLAHLGEIEAGAKRLAAIVDELLLLAGVRRMAVEPVAVDMAAVVADALGRIESLVRASGAQIECPAQWPVACGHGPWVAEIWANYLSNAVKYGGKPPRLRLGAERVPERDCVRFWVEDNGAGIEPGKQSELFRQFSRLGATGTDGQGLGLSIVRRITEKLGGAAGCESEVGHGSRFWFELPAVEPARDAPNADRPAKETT
jgi:signal transduction histidine kinase